MKYLTIIFILFVSQNIFAESTIYHCKVKDAFKINNNDEYSPAKFENITNEFSEKFSIEFKDRGTNNINLIIHNSKIFFPRLTVLPRFDRTDTSKKSYETSLRANTNIIAGGSGSSFKLNLKNLSFKFYEEALGRDLLLYGKCKK